MKKLRDIEADPGHLRKAMGSNRVEQRRGSSSERDLRDTSSNFRTTDQTTVNPVNPTHS